MGPPILWPDTPEYTLEDVKRTYVSTLVSFSAHTSVFERDDMVSTCDARDKRCGEIGAIFYVGTMWHPNKPRPSQRAGVRSMDTSTARPSTSVRRTAMGIDSFSFTVAGKSDMCADVTGSQLPHRTSWSPA